MAESFKKLAQAIATTSVATFYTSPASTQTIVKHLRVVNYSAGAASVTLYQSGTADANIILPAVTLQAGQWGEFDGTILMDAGDTLHIKASAGTAISVVAYGVQVSP